MRPYRSATDLKRKPHWQQFPAKLCEVQMWFSRFRRTGANADRRNAPYLTSNENGLRMWDNSVLGSESGKTRTIQCMFVKKKHTYKFIAKISSYTPGYDRFQQVSGWSQRWQEEYSVALLEFLRPAAWRQAWWLGGRVIGSTWKEMIGRISGGGDAVYTDYNDPSLKRWQRGWTTLIRPFLFDSNFTRAQCITHMFNLPNSRSNLE